MQKQNWLLQSYSQQTFQRLLTSPSKIESLEMDNMGCTAAKRKKTMCLIWKYSDEPQHAIRTYGGHRERKLDKRRLWAQLYPLQPFVNKSTTN